MKIRIKISPVIFVVVFIYLFLLSCTGISSDPGGSAKYYIDNKENFTINVKMFLVSQLGNEIVDTTVDSNTKKEIFSDFIIGVNPQPSNTFKSIQIFNLTNESLVNQDPINNSLWIITKTSSGDYYSADWTYIFDK